VYSAITYPLPQGVRYMAADSGYHDDHKLYDLSIHRRRFELVVCPVSQIYNHTSSDRLQLIEFYESELGQAIYSWRGILVEPLIEHIKDIFKIDPLSMRGYQKAAGLVLLSVLLYQIIVYYNCKTRKEHPKAIKHMLGS
jgi:hypothetical protein